MDTILSESDKECWKEGSCYNAHSLMGAQVVEDGVAFAVWAPHAHSVSVVGEFNEWDGRRNPMQKDEETGIWTAKISGIDQWTLYKFELKTGAEAPPFLKSDPYAYAMEVRPKNASLVYDLSGFEWGDEEWMEERGNRQSFQKPISIYEVHLASWRRKGADNNEYLSYRELAHELIPYVNDSGFTHVELMPIAEHPYDPSWGYQVTGYYAPTSRFGDPKDFMYFVDECHKNGIGVIMDWVPGHFPKDEQGLQMFDSTPLYEYGDPQKREQKDWGTYIFDYGKNGVRNFLLSNAHYWCDKYHIDGLRVDAVASMLYLDYSKGPEEWSPNKYGGNEHLEAIRFLKDFNVMIHREFPGILTFAEESTSWAGVTTPVHHDGLGFDYKWNMGWMNDTLEYIQKSAGQRSNDPNKITFPMMYNESENFVLPFSHDEVVHLKKPLVWKSSGDEPEQFANLRLLFTYFYGHPGKKLLFMGGEFAETSEWAEDRSLHWHLLEHNRHQGIKKLVDDLNALYKYEPALHQLDKDPAGFEWIALGKERPSVFSFLRKAQNPADHLLFILNFSDQNVENFSVGPFQGEQYEIILNTESEYYGGTNEGGHYGLGANQHVWMEPFSALVLKPIQQISDK
ncbi:1,4-alpha-glucan branching protein GlgB [Fodinibius sp. Rm-B-1B1-1]|uniref:1,4-alpha-glucan branching protein GlgB n=1 Tax=Fodinibius alkaliphilus TaxID=3140241 RepID=UPI00315AC310